MSNEIALYSREIASPIDPLRDLPISLEQAEQQQSAARLPPLGEPIAERQTEGEPTLPAFGLFSLVYVDACPLTDGFY